MKRYASHYLYLLPDTLYKQHIIELENNAIRCYPFTEEQERVVWLPGLLILTHHALVEPIKEGTFATFLAQIKKGEKETVCQDWFLYHIENISLKELVFTTKTAIKLLEKSSYSSFSTKK
ncbi:MAG: hypothetical protein WCQ82_04010 [Bacteroidaceae bacterium]|nr:hypothetical protein [Bacteroidaceae bacterium]